MYELHREISKMRQRKFAVTILGFLSSISLIAALVIYPLLFAGDSHTALYETIGLFLIAIVALVTLGLRRMLGGYIRFLENPNSETE